MSGGTNIPIPAWMDALGWIIPGKAYDALRTKWRAKERARINAKYLHDHRSFIKEVDHIDWSESRTSV